MAMDDMNKTAGTGRPAGSTASLPDLKAALPDVKAVLPDVKAALPDVKAAVGDVAGRVTQDLRTAAEAAKADAARLLGEARSRVEDAADDYKEGAAQQIHRVADTVREVARGFSERDQSSIAGLADDVADGIERFSDSIRSKQVGDLFADVQSFARTQPVMFAAAAFATGFLVTRFLRSSSETLRERERLAARGNPRTAQLGATNAGMGSRPVGSGTGSSALPGTLTGGRDIIGAGSTTPAGGSPRPGVPKPTQAL